MVLIVLAVVGGFFVGWGLRSSPLIRRQLAPSLGRWWGDSGEDRRVEAVRSEAVRSGPDEAQGPPHLNQLVPWTGEVGSTDAGPIRVARDEKAPWTIDADCEVLLQPVGDGLWVANSLVEGEPCWLGSLALGPVARPITENNATLAALGDDGRRTYLDLATLAVAGARSGLALADEWPVEAGPNRFVAASDTNGVIVAVRVEAERDLSDSVGDLLAIVQAASEFVAPGEVVRRSLAALIGEIRRVAGEPSGVVEAAIIGRGWGRELFFASTPGPDAPGPDAAGSDALGPRHGIEPGPGVLRGGLIAGSMELDEDPSGVVVVEVPAFAPFELVVVGHRSGAVS